MAVASGAVASRLIVTLSDAVPPADVASQVRVVPAVSVETVVAPQPVVEVTAEPSSVTVQVTSTSLTNQPLSPIGPATSTVIVGGVSSGGVGGTITGGSVPWTVRSAR